MIPIGSERNDSDDSSTSTEETIGGAGIFPVPVEEPLPGGGGGTPLPSVGAAVGCGVGDTVGACVAISTEISPTSAPTMIPLGSSVDLITTSAVAT